ncbi:ANTAR domain-containing response regulator [Belnapia sp. F-4-1]|uniref:ANTAR domain-containing response regulator n=1 Tax=Belnapia sp. F-4-1 TaxID=1545443 RepID=UPI001186E660|nr:ANTAR domain-containing protein [Belnapia sp. F-4-1]
MTGPRIPSFRNRHALVVHPDDNDRRLLDGRLRRLGLVVHCHENMPPVPVASHADVVFFDVDTGAGSPFEGLAPSVRLIALVGAETPGRLEWMLAQKPGAWLMKPIRSSGVYTALAMAFQRLEQQHDTERYLERLRLRARHRDPVEAAIMQIMHQNNCSEQEAFSSLRKAAMDTRSSLVTLSKSILADDLPPPQRGLLQRGG